MNTTTTTLTALEQTVFTALWENALDCSGGDFACAEEVDTKALGLTKQQFGALLTTLQTKRRIGVDVVFVNGDRGQKVTQVTFYETPALAPAPLVLVEPAVHVVLDTQTETRATVPNPSLAALTVGGEVTHSVAAPGCGRRTYRITRIDADGAWGVCVADTVRELTAGDVR